MLGAFREYLAQKAVVRERYLTYFLRWIYPISVIPLLYKDQMDQTDQTDEIYPILVIPVLGNFTQFRSYRFWVRWRLAGGALFATRHPYHSDHLDGTDQPEVLMRQTEQTE
jgi:hypothetical protein